MKQKKSNSLPHELKRLLFCLCVGCVGGISLALAIYVYIAKHCLPIKNDVLDILKCIAPKKVVGTSLVRVGREADGGYVMLNEFPSDSIAYSFGISDEISWDKGIADRNIPVYMYDHTIKALPYNDEHFHFFKIGVCGKNNSDSRLKTFEQLLKINGHEKKQNIILKMDIEGAEWDSLADTPKKVMEQCAQIVVEFHWIDEMIDDDKNYEKMTCVFKKINETHQSIHVHGNNYGSYKIINGIPIPSAIEVTYVRKRGHKFTKSYESYPIKNLDRPNNIGRPDYFLGYLGMFSE